MEIDMIKDLTDHTPRKPRKFRIDPDVFECAAKLPAGVVKDITVMRHLMGQTGPDGELDGDAAEEMNRMFFGILDVVLLPDSGAQFAKRMRDPLNPIDMPDINRFITWVIEEYGGGRPTTPSSDSSTLPPATGTSSTDGALPDPSTLEPSVSIGS